MAVKKGSRGGSTTADMDATTGVVADNKSFAKMVFEDLVGLGAPAEEVKEAVKSLTSQYALDKEGAEAKFKKIHDSFCAARDADAILNEETEKLTGLAKLAGSVEDLNVAKARLLARMGSNIPGVRLIARAIESLAMLELDMKGLGIDQSVFGTLANFIRGTDDQLKKRGIEVSGDKAMEVVDAAKSRVAGIMSDDRVNGLVGGVNDLADKLGIDLGTLASKVSGFDINGTKADITELTGSSSGSKPRGGRGGRTQ